MERALTNQMTMDNFLCEFSSIVQETKKKIFKRRKAGAKNATVAIENEAKPKTIFHFIQLAEKKRRQTPDDARILDLMEYDPEAGTTLLFEKYFGPLKSVCAQKLNTSGGYAEDAAIEVLTKVYSKIHTFSGRSKLSTWIFQIAKFHCIDILKKRSNKFNEDCSFNTSKILGKKQQEEMNYEDGFEHLGLETGFMSEAACKEQTESACLRSEYNEKVRYAFGLIDKKYAMPVYLREFENLSYKEIAEVIGESEGTTKTRIRRGRLKLRELLGPEGEDLKSYIGMI